MPSVEASFPEKLQCLFKPKRYKTLWGGRGAGRSWGVARWLLIDGAQAPSRNLCAREYQNSIADSVHKLLCDQIDNLGMNYIYEVQRDKILTRPEQFGPGGQTSFSFEGIKNNVTRVKSYEGVKKCWVEEANKVTKGSWQVLVPTIRTPGSEIIQTLNPELDTDYTYIHYVQNPAGELVARGDGWTETTDAFVVKMTYRDNPWFGEELRREMEDLRQRDYDAYLNVWEGHCRLSLEGAVYARELRRATEEGRIVAKPAGGVPWDRQTPVDTFWDLGRADRTAIWFAQRVAMQYRILGYYEASQEDIMHYLRHCQSREWLYGTMWLPHDAKAKRLGSRRTIEEIVRGYAAWNVRIVPKLSIEDGINAARIIFPNCWFDEEECRDGIDRLRHYRFEVKDGPDGTKHLSDKPLHDEASDGADAFRYLAVAIKQPGRGNKPPMSERLAELAKAAVRGRSTSEGARPTAGTGWMGL